MLASDAHFITGHEQTLLKQICYFHFFGVSLASKESITFQKLLEMTKLTLYKPVSSKRRTKGQELCFQDLASWGRSLNA